MSRQSPPAGDAARLALKRLAYLPFRVLLRRRPRALPLNAKAVRRILVLRYDAIGDLLVTTPVLSVLRRCLPDATVDVVASPRNRPLLDGDPRVDRVYVFRRTLASFLDVWRRCRDRRYDCVLSFVFHRTTVAGLAANAWGGRRAATVHILHSERRALYGTWFDVQVDIGRDRQTMASMQLEMVARVFGLAVDPVREPLSVFLADAHRAFAATALARLAGRRVIALNISSGAPHREWSEQANAAFLEQLLPHVDDDVLIVAGSDRSEMALRLAAIDPHRISVLPATGDFRGIVAALERVAAVITPDTSIVHAAACAAKPVVVLYSLKASFLPEWMPHGVPYEAVFTAGRLDIETIVPEAVVEAYQRLAARLPSLSWNP
jgi:ADP-heptose:LPS heptosyltransferase